MIKQEVRNALHDIFSLEFNKSDILKCYEKSVKEAVDEFKADIVNQDVSSNYNSLDSVLMLIVWLLINPNDYELIKSFVKDNNLIGRLYGGLRQVFVSGSKKITIKPCFISTDSRRYLHQQIERQSIGTSYGMSHHRCLSDVAKVLHDLDYEKYKQLLLDEETYWLNLYYFSYFNKSRISSIDDDLVDELLQSEDYIKASIAFYNIILRGRLLVDQYRGYIERDYNGLLPSHDLLNMKEVKFDLETEYDDLYTRLKTLLTNNIRELILCHIFEINRSLGIRGGFLLPTAISWLALSSSNFEQIAKLLVSTILDLRIVVESLNVWNEYKNEEVNIGSKYNICSEIIQNLIKTGALAIIGDEDTPLYNMHKHDKFHLEAIIDSAPNDVKVDIVNILTEYSKTLFSSPFDKLVRYKLYLRDYRKYETSKYIIDYIHKL